MNQTDLMGKRVVIALGGNALGDDPKEQRKRIAGSAKFIAKMIKEGINVVITHGNGPQVGIINQAFEVAHDDDSAHVPFMPLQDCNAMSQGYIGAQLTCALMNQLHEFDIMRSVVDVVTHVVVDDDDPAFKDLEKPIGAFMTKDEAEKLSEAEGVPVKEDSGRGWRRVVASPRPQHILEIDQIRDLMDAGYVVVAVIDKDLTSSILAWKLRADFLVILTAVDKVCLNFNTPEQKEIDTMTVHEAREYIDQGQFAPGSMLPKVQACVEFVEAHPGGRALIASLEHAAEALRGENGTLITA